MMTYGQGFLTPETVTAAQRTQVPSGSPPDESADPKSVMVKVIYHHIDENRKPELAHVNVRVQPDDQEQKLLEYWLRIVLAGKEHREILRQRARAMSKKETDYQWFTGEGNKMVKPLFDQQIVLFKDPPSPSYPKPTGKGMDGTSSGTSGPSDPPDPSGTSGGSGRTEGFEAPKYTPSTRSSKGKADVIIECLEVAFGHSMDANVSANMLE
jgi:hypothetical protein